MKSNLQTLNRAMSILLLSASVSSCTLAPRTPLPELSERIEAARQRSDHDALVAYYRAEAAAARDTATWHRKLASSYGDLSKSGASPLLAFRFDSIAWMYEEIALEYDRTAQYHQVLARVPAPRKPSGSTTDLTREPVVRPVEKTRSGI